MKMRSFHSATLQLLGSPQHTSSKAAEAIAQAERKLAIVMPPSVREWYSLEHAMEILAENSNDDPPIPVEKFAIMEWNSQQLLPIRIENQGVCEWAVLLDGTDDPPILVDVDTAGKEWHLLSETFSDYVYSCVWDYSAVLKAPALVQAQNGPLSEEALEYLRATFKEELTTYGWPGSAQYRFAKNDVGILLWSANDQTDWFVGATNASSLDDALRIVWKLDEVGSSFYDSSDIGKDVLEKIRQ